MINSKSIYVQKSETLGVKMNLELGGYLYWQLYYFDGILTERVPVNFNMNMVNVCDVNNK